MNRYHKAFSIMADKIKLWHGSSEPPESFDTGLQACGRGLVFLTDNPELAVDYAISDGDRTGNDHRTVIMVSVDESNLIPDPDHEQWYTDEFGTHEVKTWSDSLRASDQCCHLGDIPTSDIVSFETLV